MLSLLHLPEEGRRGGGGGRHWKVRRVDANMRRSLAIRKRSPLPFPAKRPSVASWSLVRRPIQTTKQV